ncbi:SulP family inorganic anion transporter [Bacteroidota bacterium]
MEYLRRFVPLVGQLESYEKSLLRHDLIAGLTVGVMLIPQGMAYALIAGLPPIYGLYASLVPLVVYAFFGSSRQLAVGPVAMVSLLVAAGVAPLAGGDIEAYIGFALLLSVMVGAIQLGLGLARAGFLTNFLSHPVLAGFTSAAALIIGFSQLKHLLGLDLPRSNYVHTILLNAWSQASDIHVATLLIGVASIVALLLFSRWRPGFPGALVVVAGTTTLVWAFDLTAAGVNIVGDVPGGLPSVFIPAIDFAAMRALLPAALTISLVGFMESIAVAKVYARKHRYTISADQELVGLGLANIVGSLFRAYPTTGGFSRTAVNDQAGARTNVASLISAGVIALTLLALTSLFFYLPKAVLAAVVMVAVFKLIDWKEARYLWTVDRKDLGLMAITFVATLALGIEEGILVGVVASLIVVIQQSYRPHTAALGQLPGTTTYRNFKRFPDAIKRPDLLVFRLDASLYFANVEQLKEELYELLSVEPAVTQVVLDFYPVNRIDSSALHGLSDIVKVLSEQDIRLALAGVKGPVKDRMSRSGLVMQIGPTNFHMEIHAAVEDLDKTIKNP